MTAALQFRDTPKFEKLSNGWRLFFIRTKKKARHRSDAYRKRAV